ncbi:hypothetical protein A1YU_00016 [Escherichia coli KTE142]|nr:hypothetical protein A1YU_00016 [Escherichia coli KTE142]
MKFFLSQKYLLLFIRINHFSLSMQIKKNQSKCLCNCMRWNEMHYNNIVMHKEINYFVFNGRSIHTLWIAVR